MRKKQVTILELATRLDLSPSTVSRALNGKHRISESTREKVRQLATELGYRPNVSARHLRENRTYMLGVMVPSLAARFHTLLLEAIVAQAREQSHHIILQIGQQPEDLQFLLGNHIDGVFLFSENGGMPAQLVEAVRHRELPVVLIGPESVQASRVWPKDVAAQAGNPVMVHDLVARAFDLLFDEMELIEQDEPLQFQEIRC